MNIDTAVIALAPAVAGGPNVVASFGALANLTAGCLACGATIEAYAAYRRGAAGPQGAARLSLIIGLMSLCGLSCLATGLGVSGTWPPLPGTAVLNLVTASLWVATGLRLCAALSDSRKPAPDPAPGPAPREVPAAPRPPDGDLAHDAERLAAKARMLETRFRAETRVVGNADAVRELGDIVADLERLQCTN